MSHSPAQLAEKFLAQKIQKDKAFTANSAVLYALLNDGFLAIGSHPDVYELLDTANVPAEAQAVLVHTTGWAAPLNSLGEADGAPSQHPQRRRVALMACVTDDAFGGTVMGSALGFQDDPEDIITDEGEATGALAQAVVEAWECR